MTQINKMIMETIDHEAMLGFEELELAVGILNRNKSLWDGMIDVESGIKSLNFLIEDLKQRKNCD